MDSLTNRQGGGEEKKDDDRKSELDIKNFKGVCMCVSERDGCFQRIIKPLRNENIKLERETGGRP